MRGWLSYNAYMICGIDEVGRGPLAGPVAAAAAVCIAPLPEEVAAMLRDSKKLSHLQRVRIREAVRPYSRWCIGWAWPREIDEINIRQATFLAMQRAHVGLERILVREGLCERKGIGERTGAAWEVLIDGRDVPEYFEPSFDGRSLRRFDILHAEAIIKGDTKVPEIQIAAIAAKEARDELMALYEELYPGYGLAGHKGYPTKAHREAVASLGLSDIHRKSFCGKFLVE